MRNDNYSKEQRVKSKERKPKLYGIGIGPGDPKLLTLKAKEILDKADVIFVPKAKDDSGSYARSIVEVVMTKPKNYVELVYPMTKDKNILEKYWKDSAKKIANEVKKKRTSAFVTIGDPFIYSTYIYLIRTMRRYYPKIEIETIPGISSINACASKLQVPIAEADEKFAVLPVREDLNGLKEALKQFDTVVLMKVGAKLEKIIKLLKKMKLIKNAILVSHIGHSNEKIVYNLSSIVDKKIGYLSVIIVKARSEGHRA